VGYRGAAAGPGRVGTRAALQRHAQLDHQCGGRRLLHCPTAQGGSFMITIDSVGKTYGDATVLDPASLSLPPAGVTSISGSNGPGKSTLLSIIARVLGADAGVVSVDGLDVARSPSRAVAKKLSILRQDQHTTAR